MYCDKINVNQLTSLLVSHGVREVVVCPGSRNAVLVHNFNECPMLKCYPVTDERSAAFVALGMALVKERPVVVCVTSGSALLNTYPAVAEAFYSHIPLIVISADRPASWIDQQDGQTLPQPQVFGHFVQKSVTLPEVTDEESRWWCNRLINEALLATTKNNSGPVHINIPISEPLFTFTTPELPVERRIDLHTSVQKNPIPKELLSDILMASCPILIVGHGFYLLSLMDAFDSIEYSGKLLILPELISNVCFSYRTMILEERLNQEDFNPDLVIFMGGMLVNKNLKLFLRKHPPKRIIHVEQEGKVSDIFANVTDVIQAHPSDVLDQLKDALRYVPEKREVQTLRERWKRFYEIFENTYTFDSFNDLSAMRQLSRYLNAQRELWHTHLGNSSVVRNACYFQSETGFSISCNRGLNGIEGSLSVAAGFAIASSMYVVCMIGDLSFFYDQNSLWNTNIRGNFRIVVFNNSGGQIFRLLKGLSESPVRDTYVAAAHQTTAEGIAKSYNIHYLKASNEKELDEQLPHLFTEKRDQVILLEIFTDKIENEKAKRDIHKWWKQIKPKN